MRALARNQQRKQWSRKNQRSGCHWNLRLGPWLAGRWVWHGPRTYWMGGWPVVWCSKLDGWTTLPRNSLCPGNRMKHQWLLQKHLQRQGPVWVAVAAWWAQRWRPCCWPWEAAGGLHRLYTQPSIGYWPLDILGFLIWRKWLCNMQHHATSCSIMQPVMDSCGNGSNLGTYNLQGLKLLLIATCRPGRIYYIFESQSMLVSAYSMFMMWMAHWCPPGSEKNFKCQPG